MFDERFTWSDEARIRCRWWHTRIIEEVHEQFGDDPFLLGMFERDMDTWMYACSERAEQIARGGGSKEVLAAHVDVAYKQTSLRTQAQTERLIEELEQIVASWKTLPVERLPPQGERDSILRLLASTRHDLHLDADP